MASIQIVKAMHELFQEALLKHPGLFSANTDNTYVVAGMIIRHNGSKLVVEAGNVELGTLNVSHYMKEVKTFSIMGWHSNLVYSPTRGVLEDTSDQSLMQIGTLLGAEWNIPFKGVLEDA